MIGKKLIAGGVLLIFILSLNVYGEGKDIMYVTPSNINVYLNETFTVSINVSPSSVSYSSGCDITFNSSILHVLNVLPGDFDVWFNFTRVDNINGSIKYIMGASNESIPNNITLAKIVFKAVGEGHSYINLTRAFIGDNTSIETINASVNVSRDTEPPYSIANLNPSMPNGKNGWYISNVMISISSIDNGTGVNKTYYSIDGREFEVYNATITISQDGIHEIKYYSIDNAGNVEGIKNITIKIDKTKPSLNITKYPPTITNSKNITFEWKGKDNLTPDNEIEYSYMLEGYDTSWSSWSNVKNASYYNLTDGEYIFWVKAKDKAGNINVQNKSFSINTSPPSIKNVTASPPIAKIGGYVNISCKVKGIEIKNVNISIKYPDGSIHNFSMNGKNNSYYYNSSYSGIGTYNFTIYAVDSAGNIGMANGSFKIADLTPPNVKISYPHQNDVLKGSVVIRWNATDNHDSRSQLRITIKYSKDGGATWHLLADDVFNNGSYVWDTTSMEDGKDYRLQVIAYDRAGNRGADISSVFIIDNTPPTLELKKPVAGYLYIFDRQILPVIGKNAVIIGKITVEAVATDSITGVEKVAFYIDGGEKAVVKNKPYSWEWKNIAIGKHEIMVKAYDNAGNIMEKKVEALVFIL